MRAVHRHARPRRAPPNAWTLRAARDVGAALLLASWLLFMAYTYASGPAALRSTSSALSASGNAHELLLTAPRPVPLAPILPAEESQSVDAPARCNAKAHTELDGDVVTSGEAHVVASAGACCDACAAHAAAAAPSSPGCNVWVFCADASLCGQRQGQCWLKRVADPGEAKPRGAGPAVPWASGVLLAGSAPDAKVAAHRRRAEEQRAPLAELLSATHLLVGLRNESGTIELLTPHSETEPHLSFTLPLIDRARSKHPPRSRALATRESATLGRNPVCAIPWGKLWGKVWGTPEKKSKAGP